jgi:hypothetical protein
MISRSRSGFFRGSAEWPIHPRIGRGRFGPGSAGGLKRERSTGLPITSTGQSVYGRIFRPHHSVSATTELALLRFQPAT